VYEKKPRTTVDLKQNFREEVAAISHTVLQRVMQNFQKRLGECVDNKGRHLSDTIIRRDATSQTLYSEGTPPHRHYIQKGRHLTDTTFRE
jgi:hypothetical protein